MNQAIFFHLGQAAVHRSGADSDFAVRQLFYFTDNMIAMGFFPEAQQDIKTVSVIGTYTLRIWTSIHSRPFLFR